MSARGRKPGFAVRPGDAESWVQATETAESGGTGIGQFTARLTIDVTPELRGRIKVAAFRRGTTVAAMLRSSSDTRPLSPIGPRPPRPGHRAGCDLAVLGKMYAMRAVLEGHPASRAAVGQRGVRNGWLSSSNRSG